ncbi:minor capsid protein [Sutcliffiella cohnii]|uniref:Minor capsid protein n=1 Tax=Sutcliffiella cohnii TaxID=33932 RepID=A0A223KUK6_9BACI|nr:minor capsid protein [Sutcliffiella cohnii]AST93008.1 minor capsid protein [Sutcliffiella cohnii]
MTKQHVRVTIDTKKVGPKLNTATKKGQIILSEQVLKDSNFYIPADIWNLRDSSLRSSDFENGKLIWDTPYGRRLYFGLRFNFSTDKNPFASPLWYEKARSVHLGEWERVAQKAVEEGL